MNRPRRGLDRRALTCAAVVTVALVAALVPIPAHAVERWYSSGLYPRLQTIVTPLSNLIPISFVDIGVAALLAAAMILVRRRRLGAGWKAVARSMSLTVLSTAAVLYVVFLVMWGFNYRRLPLEVKLAYEPSRVSRDAALQLGRLAVQQINHEHRLAHAATGGVTLENAFAEALRALGHHARVATGRPKRSLLSLYFRYAGIDGMTDPVFLDIVVNPDLLPMERPEVLAHEWAHLAGYADEAEANFIAWLTCLRGDPMARYSGWLSLYGQIVGALPVEDRRALTALLAEGPRADLRAIAARHARGSPVVRRAQRGVYDAYLRANRIEEGIARYNAVLRLILGTEFEPGWTPRRRIS